MHNWLPFLGTKICPLSSQLPPNCRIQTHKHVTNPDREITMVILGLFCSGSERGQGDTTRPPVSQHTTSPLHWPLASSDCVSVCVFVHMYTSVQAFSMKVAEGVQSVKVLAGQRSSQDTIPTPTHTRHLAYTHGDIRLFSTLKQHQSEVSVVQKSPLY